MTDSCLTLYGACKYQQGFTHFDYTNAQAPKGGSVKLATPSSFDSLNNFILKGVKAPNIDVLNESLMVQSWDEPESFYGLIAERVNVAPDHSSTEFTLRAGARWHDGTPITPDDVVFSFVTLRDKGDPSYKILYASIAGAQKTGERTVKFTFSDVKNRQLPLIAAQMPILSKAYYANHDFEKTTLEPPLGSGPYAVEQVDQGRSITYKRVEAYWGKDLPVRRGQYNFDHVRYDVYRDDNVAMQALKAGEYDMRQEYIARNWATAYDGAVFSDGRMHKRTFPDATPQGMQAFIFNTRLPKFADRRVREAMDLCFDFELENRLIFYDAYARNTSFFQHTEFAATGLPSPGELKLLTPFAKDLPAALFTQAPHEPVTDGSGNDRSNLLKADALLTQAGWRVMDGKRVDAQGNQLSIEFMLRQSVYERVVAPMRKNLERLGVTSTIRIADDAQFQKRSDTHAFDVLMIWLNRGVFYPGNDQVSLWQSAQADIKGSNNTSGLKSKAVDAIMAALATAPDLPSLQDAGRALDRVLLWEHVVIPEFHSDSFRVAYADKFGIPAVTPKYNLGFFTWWVKPERQ